jgi:hypothetical protein
MCKKKLVKYVKKIQLFDLQKNPLIILTNSFDCFICLDSILTVVPVSLGQSLHCYLQLFGVYNAL